MPGADQEGGSRARSLYPHSPRPATLCRAVRAYSELSALLGGQVPDLRGLFLRGHGGSSAALGVRQDDAIRNIKGQITGNGLMSGGATGPFYSWYTQNFGIGNGAYDKNGVAFDASRVVPTAEENRPVNQAVRYLVRARP